MRETEMRAARKEATAKSYKPAPRSFSHDLDGVSQCGVRCATQQSSTLYSRNTITLRAAGNARGTQLPRAPAFASDIPGAICENGFPRRYALADRNRESAE